MRSDPTAAQTASAAAAAILAVLIGVARPYWAAHAQTSGLGRIDFPTSGSPGAQPHFLRGVAALHNFEFDEAVDAFRRARQSDPGFVMAYWGEALAHYSTLASSTDVAGGRAVLQALARTRGARLARARTQKERGFLEAVEALFGDGEEAHRQRAYVDAMARLHARFPEDHEVAAFYALALLDTAIRATFGLASAPAGSPGAPSEGSHGAPGLSGPVIHEHVALAGSDTQETAGDILRKVLAENPEHPGAAHYLLHNYDDPDHAALALDVARTYARIAPESSHARHMPAHIFLQLGLWREAASSDEAASKAADAWVDEARRDYHPFTWLQYELLQLGQFRRARTMLEMMEGAAARTGALLLKNHAASMRARYVVEARRWELLRDGDDFANLDELVAIGISAARGGNVERADQVRELLSQIAGGQPPDSRMAPALRVMERQVAGLVHLATGRRDEAAAALREASDAEDQLPTGMGPPRPIKPTLELLGEVLLDAGRPADARAQFERALQRYPNRSASVVGLARATAAAGDRALAKRHYESFLANWRDADPDLAALNEARAVVGEKGTVTFFRAWPGKKVTVPLFGAVAIAVVIAVALSRRGRTRRRRAASGPRTADRAKRSRTSGGR